MCAPICMRRRKSTILVICPAVLVSTLELGPPRFSLLNALKTSQRNSSLARSVIAKDFANDRSTEPKPGPSNMLRPELPYVYRAGTVKSAGLNHMLRLGLDTFPLPIRSGLSEITEFSEALLARDGVKYIPASKLKIPLSVHPPAMAFATGLRSFPKALPRPNGRLQFA